MTKRWWDRKTAPGNISYCEVFRLACCGSTATMFINIVLFNLALNCVLAQPTPNLCAFHGELLVRTRLEAISNYEIIRKLELQNAANLSASLSRNKIIHHPRLRQQIHLQQLQRKPQVPQTLSSLPRLATRSTPQGDAFL